MIDIHDGPAALKEMDEEAKEFFTSLVLGIDTKKDTVLSTLGKLGRGLETGAERFGWGREGVTPNPVVAFMMGLVSSLCWDLSQVLKEVGQGVEVTLAAARLAGMKEVGEERRKGAVEAIKAGVEELDKGDAIDIIVNAVYVHRDVELLLATAEKKQELVGPGIEYYRMVAPMLGIYESLRALEDKLTILVGDPLVKEYKGDILDALDVLGGV